MLKQSINTVWSNWNMTAEENVEPDFPRSEKRIW
jgi:hypothetical protein